jgi:hypothetical protein
MFHENGYTCTYQPSCSFHWQNPANMSTDDAELTNPGDPQIENGEERIEELYSKSDSKTSTLQLLAQLLGGNAQDEVCTKSNRVKAKNAMFLVDIVI